MAFPVRSTYTNGRTNVTPTTVTMPSGIASGDILVLYSCGWPGLTLSTPSGWTVAGFSTQADSVKLTVFYKIADGTEPSSYSLTHGGGNYIGWTCVRYTGASSVSFAFTAVTHDPPNLAPSWGSADTLWVAGLCFRGQPSQVTAIPTGFGDTIHSNTQLAGTNTVSVCHLSEAVSSKNPASFTCLVTTARSLAFTAAFEPSAAAVIDGRRRRQSVSGGVL